LATTSPSDAAKPGTSSSAPLEDATFRIALIGNPNSGKTTLFNDLAGVRHRVGNYPGITVERIEGRTTLPDGRTAAVLDLPGCYSLSARSIDEQIARDALIGRVDGLPVPDVVVVVVDASNLARNLYLTTQVIETGANVVVALNMNDVANKRGTPVDAAAVEAALGVPVVPTTARTGAGLQELKQAILRARPGTSELDLPGEVRGAVALVAAALGTRVPEAAAAGEALRLIACADENGPMLASLEPEVQATVSQARDGLVRSGVDVVALEPELRYALCGRIADAALGTSKRAIASDSTVSERVDRVLTHKILGPIIFLVVMGVIFQAVYTWAEPFMGWIEEFTGLAQGYVGSLLGEGMLHDLIVDGVIAGVGNVIIFLPQIMILFLFLTLMEDLGYLARAAFLIDRGMRGVGLHGKAFVPLMSSFACAIPGIMATRTMENPRDRMVTIMVAPLMSCAARLPVYALMIGAFIPSGYQGITLLSMYVLSVAAALFAAWVFRKTLFKGENSTFLLELPSYKLPKVRDVLLNVWDKGLIFIKQAGTVILAISVVLWALAYFPQDDKIAEDAAQQKIEARQQITTAVADAEEQAERIEEAEGAIDNWASGEQLAQSYAGTLGHAIEPVIQPLGFDWKIGIGLIASFAAREVLVSTLAVVYSVGEEDDEETPALRQKLQDAKRPDGSPAFSWLTAISIMVFFVLACQCMSTLAVVKRETNSWRWPLFMFGYMTVLAYVASLIVYQGGLALGLG
jgi:ferrous iron transport protein B